MRATPTLPDGFGLALDPDVRRPRPELLVGGTPIRVLRLTAAGAGLIDRWASGEPVSAARAAQALTRRLLDAGIAHPRPPAYQADVTAVIPVRDDPDGLAATLGVLAGLEIVVVDDGSTSAVPGAVRHEQSKGPAAARNTGWWHARGDIVVFVDAGCRPQPGWLPRLLAHFADPSVGAVAPRVVSSPAPGLPGWLARYEGARSSLDLGRQEAPVRPGSRVPYVPTATLAVRRAALAAAGGFDEALRYGEDVDFVWRLDGLGWRVRYEPAVGVTHPSRGDVGSWLRQRFDYGRSAAPLARRHARAVAPLAASPWSLAAWGLVAAGYPLAGSLMAAATAATLARQGGRGAALTLARLAATGHVRAGAGLATAIRRAWLPPAVLVAGAAWAAGRRSPAWWLAAALARPLPRLADDLAYQAGVWSGVIESRSAAALFPRW